MDVPTSPNPLIARWNALSVPGKVVLAVLLVVLVTLLLSVLKTLSLGMRGPSLYGVAMDGGYGVSAPTMPAYEMGFAQNKVSSSRIAMDYDESYYPTPYPQAGGTGSYEETEYETRNYSAHIKTHDFDGACRAVEALKPLQYIVFEQANRGEAYCSYRFKSERASAELVLAALEKLDPRNLNEQTEVVKRQLLEYTSALDVLQKREALLAKTLDDVSAAYDELVTLSKDARDVETLAKVIDGKLNYIERLSQQRLQVASELESLARQKADLTDRIDYVYFDVSVEKVEYVNGEEIKDSWTYAVRAFIQNINETAQSITFGMLALVLWLIQLVLQAAIFFVVVLVVAKYGWRATKKFWQS
jgi:hypothetical protein